MSKVDEAVELYVEWFVNCHNKSTIGAAPELRLMESRFDYAKSGLSVGEREELRLRVYDRSSDGFDSRLRHAEMRYT